jgi:hypothetical protein
MKRLWVALAPIILIGCGPTALECEHADMRLDAYQRCKSDLGCMLNGQEYRRLVADERLKAICAAKGLGRRFETD